ncbi:MAG TPA: M20/M25/M40 family metallo-hydrolase [Pyrinomonadaceae bacterium]|jgi:Zn-dependent M28 family amino/carboxypeptidase
MFIEVRRKLLFLLLVVALTAPLASIRAQSATSVTSAIVPASARESAEKITAAQLRDYLYFVASDEMEGRDTPSRGLDTVAKFLAMNLSRWGLKPAGDNGSYFQKISLRRSRLDPAKTQAEIAGHRYTLGQDFFASLNPGTASGQVVYVGHGWVIKNKNIDAYRGVDIKDKIVVFYGGGLPKGTSLSDLSGNQGGDWDTPSEYAWKHGAKGAIIIPDSRVMSNLSARRQVTLERTGQFGVAAFEQKEAPGMPMITASAAMIKALFQGEKLDGTQILNQREAGLPGESFELSAQKRVNFTVANSYEETTTQNVVAILEGRDPVLKNEYVAVGAHYDHVGVRTGAGITGDKIFNGADDDGSGTVAVLAMAEALSHSPIKPKRSVLFIWHTGEERGLWGSQYFTDNPTVPLASIITELNIDMIGRSKRAGDTSVGNRSLTGPDEIYVIGSKMMSTELGQLSEAVNKSYLNLSFNYLYDNPKDPNRFFFRSDHFNYARKGIPIIFYFDGEHEDYHKPTDSPDKIDYQKMEKVARTIYVMLLELANAKTRPKVDRPLSQEVINSGGF